MALALALVASVGAGAEDEDRFLEQVFDEVTVTSDLVYGTAPHLGETVELRLDLYEPVGDTAEARPVVVWIHGGSFQTGDKAGPLEVLISTELTRRGYVVASIGYRLASGNLGTDIANAYQDGRAAVAWLRANAEGWRLDDSRVVASGMSAGAVTALALGYQPNRGLGQGTPDDPSHVDAVVSFAGAGGVAWPEVGEPPAFMVHGSLDTVVPYASAVAFCDALLATGLTCEFLSFEAGHVDVLANLPGIYPLLSAWLHDELDLAGWSASPPTTTTTAPATTTTAPASTTTAQVTTTTASVTTTTTSTTTSTTSTSTTSTSTPTTSTSTPASASGTASPVSPAAPSPPAVAPAAAPVASTVRATPTFVG